MSETAKAILKDITREEWEKRDEALHEKLSQPNLSPVEINKLLSERRTLDKLKTVAHESPTHVRSFTADAYLVEPQPKTPQDFEDRRIRRTLRAKVDVEQAQAARDLWGKEVRALRLPKRKSDVDLASVHNKKVLAVALRYRANESAMRGRKYFLEVDRQIGEDGTATSPSWPGAPKTYAECYKRKSLRDKVYAERKALLTAFDLHRK